MSDYQKRLVDAFSIHLKDDFQRYYDAHGKGERLDEFITFLIDYNVIDPATIKRYAILREFDDCNIGETAKKTNIVKRISAKYNMGERTVWSLLKKNKQQFYWKREEEGKKD